MCSLFMFCCVLVVGVCCYVIWSFVVVSCLMFVFKGLLFDVCCSSFVVCCCSVGVIWCLLFVDVRRCVLFVVGCLLLFV